MKKPSSINPTLAVLSFWWKKSGKAALKTRLGKVFTGLFEAGVVLAVHLGVIFFCAILAFFIVADTILFRRIFSGSMGNSWIAPWDWLSGIGMEHSFFFVFMVTFLGAFGVAALVFLLIECSVEPVEEMLEEMPSWLLAPLGLLGLIFFVPGLVTWIVLGLGFGLWKACCWSTALPCRLKTRRDRYLEKNPEILTRIEKARLESGTDPATAPSRKSRL